ncbi:hypothetical protein V1Y59_10260 [Gordonia sp. PKS22-38]|uniref:Uncharacterized protein n=1 Tax=Gordonia prachuapensis TaxID=3115651 RepID=A0ABU7MU35_9ACTN|nr:hypothetical protein [Gordonia sp. PKS22-38]
MRSTNEHVLIDEGKRLSVVESRGSTRTTASLRVDGAEVGDVSGSMLDTKDIEADDIKVRIRFGLRREVKRAELIGGGAEVIGGDWFKPPDGTASHRLWQFRDKHPGLYAARRVVTSALGAVVAVFGIGALVRAIVERYSPDIDLPDVTLPSVDLPDWMQYLNPMYWLRAPIDAIRAWMPSMNIDLPPWFGIIVPVAISVALAWLETRRQRRRRSRSAEVAGDPDDEKPTGRDDADR